MQIDYSPVVSYTEYRLLRLLRKLFGKHDIQATTTFATLGGNPAQIATLLSLIEKEFGCSFATLSLKDHASIRLVAEQIDKINLTAWSVVVKIRDGDGHPPLFLVHDVLGSVLYAHALIKNITFPCPVYVLQSATLAGHCSTHRSLEEMAAFYVDKILIVEPDGPYWIGGYSFGGVAAFEIARQLTSSGKTVLGAFNFDSLPPRMSAFIYDVWSQKTVSHPQANCNQSQDEEVIMFGNYRKRSMFKRCKMKIRNSLIIKRFEVSTRLGLCQPMSRRIKYTKRIHRSLFHYYKPIPNIVQAYLFRSDEWAHMGADGWAGLCLGCLHVVKIPGKHGDMFRQPQVKEIGTIVSNIMAGIEVTSDQTANPYRASNMVI